MVRGKVEGKMKVKVTVKIELDYIELKIKRQ